MARIMRRKIPEVVQQLLVQPQQFSIHQALRLLENHWLKSSVSQATNTLRLLPAADLSFPISDIRRSSMDSYGNISLELSFMGLYGVDSPLPLYFSQLAVQDTEAAKRVRKLLAMINHKIYVYHYLAWKQQQYLICNEQGDKRYYQLIADLMAGSIARVAPEAMDYAGIFLLKKHSAANLISLLSHHLQGVKIAIKKFIPSELVITDKTLLGQQTFLHRNSFLGQKLTVANRYLAIIIGPITLQVVKHAFLNPEQRQSLGRLLKTFLPLKLRYRVDVNFSLPKEHRAVLGSQEMLLNWYATLGAANPEGYVSHIAGENLLL